MVLPGLRPDSRTGARGRGSQRIHARAAQPARQIPAISSDDTELRKKPDSPNRGRTRSRLGRALQDIRAGMKHGQAADRADGAPRALLRARRPEFSGYVYLWLEIPRCGRERSYNHWRLGKPT